MAVEHAQDAVPPAKIDGRALYHFDLTEPERLLYAAGAHHGRAEEAERAGESMVIVLFFAGFLIIGVAITLANDQDWPVWIQWAIGIALTCIGGITRRDP